MQADISNLMTGFILFLMNLTIAVYCFKTANKNGLNGNKWGFYGWIGGMTTLLFLYVIIEEDKKSEKISKSLSTSKIIREEMRKNKILFKKRYLYREEKASQIPELKKLFEKVTIGCDSIKNIDLVNGLKELKKI